MAPQQPLNGNGYLGRASFYVSLVSAAAILIGAIAWVGSIANQVTQSGSEIGAIKLRVAQSESDLRSLQITAAEIRRTDCQTFARIETQFGTTETIINEMHVVQIRDHGSLWLKLFGETQPSIYYEIKIPHEVMPC